MIYKTAIRIPVFWKKLIIVDEQDFGFWIELKASKAKCNCSFAVSIVALEVLDTHIRSAFIYVALFMLWRISVSITSLVAPRVADPIDNMITFIDVLGRRRRFPMELFMYPDVCLPSFFGTNGLTNRTK